jgi:hypothetical protein
MDTWMWEGEVWVFNLPKCFLALRAVLGPIECGAFHAALCHGW